MITIARIKLFNYFLYILFGILIFSLFRFQIIDGDYYRTRSENNRIRLIPVKTVRGRIFDTNHVILADNRPSFNLYIIPKDFNSESAEVLSEIIDIPAQTIRSTLTNTSQPSFVPRVLKRDISSHDVHCIEERSTDFGGVFVEVSGTRYYPLREIGAHVIGYLGKISKDEYATKKFMGYLINDYVGRTGIEYLFEEVLRGVHGGEQIEVNYEGRKMRVLAEKKPFPGNDLTLTIDSTLQKKVYELLGNEVASICLMDINSGEILTLLSNPSFDPNAFVTPSRSNERIELLRDQTLPFLNRVISSRYPPGSVFKLVTALAALDAGKITQHTAFTCTGVYKLSPDTRPFHCWSKYGHGTVTLEKAIQQSCNIYFYQIGRLLGADQLARFARKLRLGEPVNIELPSVARGLIPSTTWKRKRFHEPWYQGETLHYAIGQGYIAITPLQVLRFISIIANEGTIIEPTIIKGVQHNPEKSSLSKQHVQVIKRAMLKAVDTRYGTGHLAKVDFFKIAGKTGTAETKGEPHSWFAGFFPYHKPKIAMVIVVEHGGVGGIKAAKLAKEIATIWYDQQNERAL
ncbi:MAG: penicillin-binding protein 2 [Candidatus Omnitrophica bacterium]|nr:penicillin-binding protein 2 [Candidatus Omnitrophota bacterium]